MKKTVFLSHISEEGQLGTIFKDRLEKDFLSLIDVFVSSDARSIPPGDAWLKAVDTNLDQAAALIVLASSSSVVRPWITFEAGAGWAKKVPTMLVCHSGMSPGGLPLPLGQLQAFAANDIARMKAMYSVIAGVLGSATPEPDLTRFVADIQAFERNYTEERDILSALRAVQSIEKQIIALFRSAPTGTPYPIHQLPESLLRKIEPHLDQLKGRGLLAWSFATIGLSLGGNGAGNIGTLTVTISPPLATALQRSEFA